MWPMDAALAPLLDWVAVTAVGTLEKSMAGARSGVSSAATKPDAKGSLAPRGGSDNSKKTDGDNMDSEDPEEEEEEEEQRVDGAVRSRKNKNRGPKASAPDHDEIASEIGGVSLSPATAGPGSVGTGLGFRAVCFVFGLVMLALAGASCISGWLSIEREFRMDHELYGNDEKDMAQYLIDNVSAKAVIVHSNNHRALSGMLAGKPSVVAYDGWMWSHGYNYGGRHADRQTIMEHLVKDSDVDNYNRMRQWGIRYVLAENPRVWPTARKNPQVFLDGKLRRVHQSGRFQLFEVMGYGFDPT